MKLQGEAQRSVSTFLGEDHDRLDTLFLTVREALEGGQLEEAASRFAKFRKGLERHIRMEEELLFPEFERLSGMPPQSGPTQVMRMEHQEIGQLLSTITDMLMEARNPLRVARDLLTVLGDHNTKEEAVLYPMTDRMAGPQGSDELTRRMEMLNEEA